MQAVDFISLVFNLSFGAGSPKVWRYAIFIIKGDRYPEDSQIEAAAEKLDILVEELKKLCDRVYK